MAAAAILKNRKITISRPQLKRFRRNLAYWCTSTFLTFSTVKNLKFKKSNMAASAILKIQKIAISRPRFERFRQNLAQWCSSTRLTVLTVEKLKFWKYKLWIDMHKSFNIDKHLTEHCEQHWQPVFLFSKPSVSIYVCCSYIESSRSKLHKTGDLQVGNWHVNCQHSSLNKI